eukprot:g52167.t1
MSQEQRQGCQHNKDGSDFTGGAEITDEQLEQALKARPDLKKLVLSATFISLWHLLLPQQKSSLIRNSYQMMTWTFRLSRCRLVIQQAKQNALRSSNKAQPGNSVL